MLAFPLLSGRVSPQNQEVVERLSPDLKTFSFVYFIFFKEKKCKLRKQTTSFLLLKTVKTSFWNLLPREPTGTFFLGGGVKLHPNSKLSD